VRCSSFTFSATLIIYADFLSLAADSITRVLHAHCSATPSFAGPFTLLLLCIRLSTQLTYVLCALRCVYVCFLFLTPRRMSYAIGLLVAYIAKVSFSLPFTPLQKRPINMQLKEGMRSQHAMVADLPRSKGASRSRCASANVRIVRLTFPLVFLTVLPVLVLAGDTSLTSPVAAAAVARTAASTTPRTTSTRDVSLRVIQQATTDGSTRSLSFLSAGYQSESAFLADVDACVSTLTNSTGGVASDPWPRYIALFNVYALYEPSPQLGANRMKSHQDSCTFSTDCTARTVMNNLNCAFGSPNPQVLSCDVNLVRSMAFYAPAQDVVVVLVNDDEPRGVGTDGLLYITNKPTFMPFMLVHYLNRAVAGLQEEYSLGIYAINGEQTLNAANCAASPSAHTAQSWVYWQNYNNDGLFVNSATTSAGSSADNVSGADVDRNGLGCSVASYVAPTRGGCLMQSSSVHHMCPVCKEQLSLAFFHAGTSTTSHALLSPRAVRLDLTAGRCPPAGHTYYVASVTPPASQLTSAAAPLTTRVTKHLYLSLGSFASQSDVEVVWTSENGTILATNTQTLVIENVSSLWTLPTTVTATVTDATQNVRPSWRAERRANMTSTTTFAIAAWTDDVNCASASKPTCFASRTVFAAVAVMPSAVCAPLTSATKNRTAAATAAAAVDELVLSASGTDPKRPTVPIIVSSIVCGGLTLLLVAVITLVFYCCVQRRPREVLNPTHTDNVVYYTAVVLAPLGITLAGLVIVFVCSFVPAVYYTGSPVVLTLLVMACMMYVSATMNFCGVLLRRFVAVLVCGVLSLLLGAGFFACGLLSLIFYLDRGSQVFSDRVSRLWQHLLSSDTGSAYVCNIVQATMRCSGFHAGCFMTMSAECPPNCSNNLLYVNSCGVSFAYYVGNLYLPLAIVALAGGFWFVLLGTLDMTYYVRFRQLPRNGRLRRAFRNMRKPPMTPITYQEVAELHRMFALVCNRKQLFMTVEGETAVRFLETVFAEPLSDAYAQRVRTSGPLTFDALMTLHFPFLMRLPQLAVSQVGGSPPAPCVAMEKEQQATQRWEGWSMDRYAEAAGALSPEELHRLLHAHLAAQGTSSSTQLTERVLVECIRLAAAQAEAAPFCHGLTTSELAGLRRVWTALHPAISGTLTDTELVLFYQWSHTATSPLNADGLAKWKASLDIMRSGHGVGWREFCYPYAQRALNTAAESFLKKNGCDIPPGVVSRARVADRYGSEECKAVFLPREKEVPVARVVAHLLTQDLSPSPATSKGRRKPLAQRAEGVVRTLTEMNPRDFVSGDASSK
jgi:hypothetical protein